MNNREKLLIGAVSLVVVLFLGSMLFSSYRKGLTKLDKDLVTAREDLKKVDRELLVARSSQSKLADWKDQSLPAGNVVRAYQLYSNWLVDTLEKGKDLHADKIERMITPVLSPTIGTVGVKITSNKGSLTALVEFLHRFYSSPQLHQISRLEITPETNGTNLKIGIQAEALILPDTGKNTVPPEGKINPFKLADVSDYRVAVNDRDIFKPYRKPGEPRPVDPTATAANLGDEKFAKFTATNLGPKGMVAWIYKMNTGDTMFVSEGEAVNVGTWKSKVVTVEPRALVLEKDGKQTKVDIGSLITAGKAVATPLPVQKKPESSAAPVEDESEVFEADALNAGAL